MGLIQSHFVIRRNGKILRQRLAALQQLVHTRDQDPLQPLQRLQGIQAKRLIAGEGAAVRRRLLPVLRFAQQGFNGAQAIAHAIVKSPGESSMS